MRRIGLREIGDRLKRFLRTREARQFLKGYDFEGWSAGGCFLLAEAVFIWLRALKPQLVAVASEQNPIEHVGVQVAASYFDERGRTTAGQFARGLKVRKGRIVPLDRQLRLIAWRHGVFCPAGIAPDLARLLEERIGKIEGRP